MSRQLRNHFLTSLFLLCAVQTEIYSYPYYYIPTRNIYISRVVTVPLPHRNTNSYDFLYDQSKPEFTTRPFEIDNSVSYSQGPEDHEDDRRPVYGGNALIVHSGSRACQGYHDRINPASGSCETIGTQGSCGALMIFLGNEETHPEDRTYGHCECDYDRYAHPLVSVGGQCHFLFTQATCLPGYWLTMSATMGPVCRVNPCASSWQMSNNGSGWEKRLALYKGECVELDSPASNVFCSRDDEVVTFVKGSLEPKCRVVVPPPRIIRRQITRPKQVACREGHTRIYGKCIQIVVVQFDDGEDEV